MATAPGRRWDVSDEAKMIDWETEWKAAHKRSPLNATPENEGRWRDFWNEDAEYYLDEIKEDAPLCDKVVERLLAEGWVRESDDVLDIGSGPGTFALPLAPHVRSITALDESEPMLDVLRREGRERGIANVRTVQRPFGEYVAKSDHSFVLASLTPAIRCTADLLAMEGASSSRCCFITSCPSKWMGLRDDLWRRIVGEYTPSDAYSVKYPLNILLEAKRELELYRVTAETEMRRSVQDVIDHYVRYFRIFTEMTEEKVEIVREHVLARSDGGLYSKRTVKCLAVLCWKIPDHT